MSKTLDKLLLTVSLDLSKHLAVISLDLSTIHIFANFKEFCHAVASNRACLLYLLAYIVNYNVATYNKVLIEYSK